MNRSIKGDHAQTLRSESSAITRLSRPGRSCFGHTDIKTTAKFYTTATVEDVRQAMKKGSGE